MTVRYILNFSEFGFAGKREKFSTAKKGGSKAEEKVAYRDKGSATTIYT
jgi:hypothetical protein